jgi:hypothetical protein
MVPILQVPRFRLPAVTIALAVLLLAADDAREIVRRSVNLGDENLRAARNYTFRERSEGRTLNGAGEVTKTEVETYDVTLVDGSPYRRLVSRDDKPLPPKDERKEQEKLRKIADTRRKEDPEQRRKRVAEWDRKREQQRETLREVVNAFDFQIAGEDRRDGREQYVIEAMPHPGYKPRTRNSGFFPKVKGRIWIDKQDYHWSRIEAEVIETISFGGILVRLAKGSRLEADQARINDEVWLPKHFEAEASARVGLVKKFHGRMEITYSEYKKFQTDSRIVATEPLP